MHKAVMLLAAGAATAPAMAQDVAKIAITPQSQNAALIIKAPNLPPPPTYRTAYRINLQAYDAEKLAMRGGPFGGGATFAARPKAFVDGYLVVDIKPGTYVFRDISKQDFWALCFNNDSRQFTVKPGEVVYLGEIDARLHMAELQHRAIMSGQIRTNKLVHFFDGVSPPAIAPIDEAGLAAAAAMVTARMPKTSVAPKAAEFSPARFGTGSDLFGLSRVCGGYHTKRAK